MVDAFLREQLSKVFQLPAARIDSDKGLDQLGIDSLMAIELQNSLKMATGVEFSTMQLSALPQPGAKWRVLPDCMIMNGIIAAISSASVSRQVGQAAAW